MTTSNALRDLIDEHWVALEAQPPSSASAIRISDLPVGSTAGPLAVGVDHAGVRHLLIPIGAYQAVRRGLDGPVLVLLKRSLEAEDTYQSFADLSCMRADLNDVFTGLCADVLATVESMPRLPLKALYTVLDRWKALFQTKGAPLSGDKLAGLFAELTVLERLLQREPSAHRLWFGPTGHRHDFTIGAFAIEVKASTATQGRRVRVHGLEQLESPSNGVLHLAWFRLEKNEGGSINELAARVIHLSDDESATMSLLAQYGYRTADAGMYDSIHFQAIEERWYSVDADFPRLIGQDLISAGISINIYDVEYTIDLSHEPPVPLEGDQVDKLLAAMITETA